MLLLVRSVLLLGRRGTSASMIQALVGGQVGASSSGNLTHALSSLKQATIDVRVVQTVLVLLGHAEVDRLQAAV